MSDRGRLILSAALFGGGCVFRFTDGYEFLGYALIAVSFVVLYYYFLHKIRDKYPKIERIMN